MYVDTKPSTLIRVQVTEYAVEYLGADGRAFAEGLAFLESRRTPPSLLLVSFSTITSMIFYLN